MLVRSLLVPLLACLMIGAAQTGPGERKHWQRTDRTARLMDCTAKRDWFRGDVWYVLPPGNLPVESGLTLDDLALDREYCVQSVADLHEFPGFKAVSAFRHHANGDMAAEARWGEMLIMRGVNEVFLAGLFDRDVGFAEFIGQYFQGVWSEGSVRTVLSLYFGQAGPCGDQLIESADSLRASEARCRGGSGLPAGVQSRREDRIARMIAVAGVRLSPEMRPVANGYDYQCIVGSLSELREVVIQFRNSAPRFSVKEVVVIPAPGEENGGE